jgi:hypothetical protein
MNVLQIVVVCAFLGTAQNEAGASLAAGQAAAGPWEIAPEVSWYRYREPRFMKNEGVLYGVAMAYTQQSGNDFWRLEAGVSTGEVDYDGALQDGTPYKMSGSRDWLLRLHLLKGYPWQTEEWDNHFYMGIAYRLLSDDSSSDPAGYERVSNYFYVPLGLRAGHALRDGWDIGLGGEFDFLLLGIQISDVGIDPPQTNVQWPGFGLRGSLEIRHRSDNADLAIAPFVQYWWVDESEENSEGWYEPENNTLQAGASLIWRF